MSTDDTITSYTATDTNEQANKAAIKNLDVSMSIDNSLKQQTGLMSNLQTGKIGAFLTAAGIETLKALHGALDFHAKILENTSKQHNENIEKIRKAYGGLGLKEFDYIPESAASNAVRRFKVITYAAAKTEKTVMGMSQTGEVLLESLTKSGINIFDKYFDSAEEAARKVEAVLGDLSTTYGKHIANLSDQQIAKLGFYEESLGVSADVIQKYFEKQIGFTEEITLESMDKLGYYARNLSKELNIPMSVLTDYTMKMMSNTEMFGDITVEEATRMSARLKQLGYTYEELNELQNKFATFSGAAQAAGTMAQLTGVQVDAMKMSYLASEGKFDELIEYQRESLLKAGMTKEKFLSQSNSMKNAIAKAFGRSQEELAFLLSDQRRISSQAELDTLMGKEDKAAEVGFETLLENLTQVQNSYQGLNDNLNKLNTKMYVESSENAYKAAKQFSTLNTELSNNTTLLQTNRDAFTQANNAYYDSITSLSKLDGRNTGIVDLGKQIVSSSEQLMRDAGGILTGAEGIQKRINDLNQENINNIAAVQEANSSVTEIESASAAVTSPEQQLTSELQSLISGENITVTNSIQKGAIIVNLDGKEIAAQLELNGIQSVE